MSPKDAGARRARAGADTDETKLDKRSPFALRRQVEAERPAHPCLACRTSAWLWLADWPEPGAGRWLCGTCSSRPAPSLAAIYGQLRPEDRERLQTDAAKGNRLARLVLELLEPRVRERPAQSVRQDAPPGGADAEDVMVLDDDRDVLLELAGAHGSPSLRLRQGVAVPAGEAAWKAFTACATAGDLAAARAALEEMTRPNRAAEALRGIVRR